MDTLKLETVFKQIANTAAKEENQASQILSIIKTHKLHTLEAFNEAVYAAYDANGWNYKTGRPTESIEKVPKSIKVYVSKIRKAYDLGLEVWNLKSMYQITDALEEAKPKPKVTPEKEPDLIGVHISTEDKLTDHLFHDAVLIFKNLESEDDRDSFRRSLNRLLNRYKKVVHLEAA